MYLNRLKKCSTPLQMMLTFLCLVSILVSPVSSFDTTLQVKLHTIILPAENIHGIPLWEKPKNNEKAPSLELSSTCFTVESVSCSLTEQYLLVTPQAAQRLSTLLLQTQHASSSL
jgi:hypothetical protein